MPGRGSSTGIDRQKDLCGRSEAPGCRYESNPEDVRAWRVKEHPNMWSIRLESWLMKVDGAGSEA